MFGYIWLYMAINKHFIMDCCTVAMYNSILHAIIIDMRTYICTYIHIITTVVIQAWLRPTIRHTIRRGWVVHD